MFYVLILDTICEGGFTCEWSALAIHSNLVVWKGSKGFMYELLAGSLRSKDLRTEEQLDDLFFSPLGHVWRQLSRAAIQTWPYLLIMPIFWCNSASTSARVLMQCRIISWKAGNVYLVFNISLNLMIFFSKQHTMPVFVQWSHYCT